jgi:hypothetical protein
LAEARSVPLFHHQPPPRTVFGQHAGAAELPADRKEAVGGRREIKQAIAAGLAFGLELVELIAHRVE